MIDGATNRRAYQAIERTRETQALREFEIKDVSSFFMWHPYTETIKGVTLKIVAQQFCTYGPSSIY